ARVTAATRLAGCALRGGARLTAVVVASAVDEYFARAMAVCILASHAPSSSRDGVQAACPTSFVKIGHSVSALTGREIRVPETLDGVSLSDEHRGQGLAAFRILGSPRDDDASRAQPCPSCSQTESRDGHDPFRPDVPPVRRIAPFVAEDGDPAARVR